MLFYTKKTLKESVKSGLQQRFPLSSLLNIVLQMLAGRIKQEKELSETQRGKQLNYHYLQADLISLMINLKKSTRKILEISTIPYFDQNGRIKNFKKPTTFLYTNYKHTEILDTLSFTTTSMKINK